MQDRAELKITQFPASSPSLSICWAMAKEATAQGVADMAMSAARSTCRYPSATAPPITIRGAITRRPATVKASSRISLMYLED